MRRPCCEVETNLVVREQAADRVIKVCAVCGARTIEVTIDPLRLGVFLPH